MPVINTVKNSRFVTLREFFNNIRRGVHAPVSASEVRASYELLRAGRISEMSSAELECARLIHLGITAHTYYDAPCAVRPAALSLTVHLSAGLPRQHLPLTHVASRSDVVFVTCGGSYALNFDVHCLQRFARRQVTSVICLALASSPGDFDAK